MKTTLRRALLTAALGAGTAGVVLPATPADAPAGFLSSCTATDWTMFGHDLGRSFASPDTCISPVTAATLTPKWFFNTNGPVSAQPMVAGGSVYVGAFTGLFYSISAAAGTQNWAFDTTKYDHEVTDYGVDASAAVTTLGGTQMVLFGGGDTFFVLKTSDGSLLGSQCLDRLDPTCQGKSHITSEIESSPAIVAWTPGASWTPGDDLVVVGNDANEAAPSPVEGLVALQLSPSGALTPLWQFDPETLTTYAGLAPPETTPADHGCGDVWSSPTVDLASRTIVFGAGNCGHPANPNQDESTFAVALDSGDLLWQARPDPYTNQRDFDFGATPNLLGSGLVGEGGKDGTYYAYRLDSSSTSPTAVWKTTVATGSGIGGMIGSTAVGRITDPVSGATDEAVFCDTAIPVAEDDPSGSIENDVTNPTQAMGVHAIDAVTHQVVWNLPAAPTYGAAVFDNGVVFVPDTVSDSLLVLDADTGAVIKAIPLDAPSSSPVAISGGSLYMGAGTTENGLPGTSSLGGVWGFQTVP
ncbi:MAG TPA: PQQ-binding-like beta-propeller repeat protein [Acidimicrobiales bacterium]|nr:PQQ-binding-like beta-propeller repeat protein [Acidimicrobiales bacterium]